MAEVQLDIAHVWQLDPDSHVPQELRRSMCAPASANMVLDYLLGKSGQNSYSLKEIAIRMEKHGGRVENIGWKHSAQVATLKEYGLTSWRRNWLAPPPINERYFIENEGYDQDQVRAFLSQLAAEEKVAAEPRAKSEFCIKQSLLRGAPVMASVAAGFSINEIGHLVVISGFNDEAITIFDPILPAMEQKPTPWDYFWEYFKLQAIFVLPPT